MVTIVTIIATKRVYPLSPNFFNNQYLLLNHQVNIPLSRNFFLNSYFISQAKNIKAKFKIVGFLFIVYSSALQYIFLYPHHRLRIHF